MAKTKREIAEDIKIIDVVIEILDARIPFSSQNPDIKELTKKKKKIILLNKCDLANDLETKKWQAYFKKQEIETVQINANDGKGISQTIAKIEEVMQEELKKEAQRGRVGKIIRVLGLPKVIKEFLNTGKLSMGQARTILGLKDKTKLVPLAQRAVEQNLTVRQLEEIVTQTNGTAKKKEERRTQRKPIYIREAESQLQSKFGTKVAVAQSRKKGAGKIEIPYTSNEDFTRILELLNITLD